jgi:photosystem II stability/assembly factor-like uncharacterized protein
MNAKRKFRNALIAAGIVIISAIGIGRLAMRPRQAWMPPQRPEPRPAPTIVVRDEGLLDYRKRDEWIELMHRAAPGTDWRRLDQETRELKVRRRLDQALAVKWSQVGSRNLAGRIHCADYDPASKLIYCAAAGGQIWRGRTDGTGWVSLNERLKMDIKSLRIIPTASGHRILVCSNSAFYYSDNEGQTWIKASGLQGPAGWGSLKKAVVLNDASRTIYLLAQEWNYSGWYAQTAVYRSTDGGLNFASITSFPEPTYGSLAKFDIWADYADGQEAFLAENANVHKIAGTTLTKIGTASVTTPGDVRLTGLLSGALTLYLLVAHDGRSDIYASSNGGTTWSFKGTVPETPFHNNSFSMSAVNPGTVYMGGVNCYRSVNGGAAWTKLSDWWEYYDRMKDRLHADICGINAFAAASDMTLVSTDGGIYISRDALKNVSNLSLKNLNVSQYYSTLTSRRNGTSLYAGSQDQGFQTCLSGSSGGPADFVQQISGDYGHLVSGDNLDTSADSVWSVYPTFAMYSLGPNLYSWNFTCSGQLWMPPLLADPSSSQKACLGGGGPGSGAFLYSLAHKAGKISAEKQSFNFQVSGQGVISAIAASPFNKLYRYVMTSTGRFFASKDGGKTWTMAQDFDGPDSHYFYGSGIWPSRTKLGTVTISGSGYSNPPVYQSVDNGKTFKPLNTGLPSTLAFQVVGTDSDDLLFAATEVGPYLYRASTKQWADLSNGGAPDQTYWSVEYLPNRRTARFGTYGRGIWDCDVSALTKDPTLTVKAPKGGEKWTVGTTHTILWKTVGSIAKVRIKYSTDGGATWTMIANAAKNTGSYSWKVPSTPSANCLVRISDAKDNSPFDMNDKVFSIVHF